MLIAEADAGVLTLRAEAPDEEGLQRVEHLAADRLERLGKRDHLTVTWTLAQNAGEQLPSQSPRVTRDTPCV